MSETTDAFGEKHDVGSYHFTDSHGFKRYWGRGCNLYGSAEDALASAKRSRRRGATGQIYVFRTTDWLFDYSMVRNPQTPELRDAVQVYPEVSADADRT